MAQHQEHNELNDKEFGTNWVTSSKFLFYLQLLIMFSFVFGCSYGVYKSTRFESKPRVEVQESSQYTPKYK